jgi:hypothetical protein
MEHADYFNRNPGFLFPQSQVLPNLVSRMYKVSILPNRVRQLFHAGANQFKLYSQEVCASREAGDLGFVTLDR